jgi:hypothetical protein
MQRVTVKVNAGNARHVEIFNDLNHHAELGFMENRTSSIRAKQLAALWFQVQTGIGRTGVVGMPKSGPRPKSCSELTSMPARWKKPRAWTKRARSASSALTAWSRR